MSTSALIGIIGSEFWIYKHIDGYPEGSEGVLAFLDPFTTEFFKYRTEDEQDNNSSFLAIMLRHQTAWLLSRGRTIGGVLHDGTPEKYRRADFYSWSLCHNTDLPHAHYKYFIDRNGDIDVFRATKTDYELLETVVRQK